MKVKKDTTNEDCCWLEKPKPQTCITMVKRNIKMVCDFFDIQTFKNKKVKKFDLHQRWICLWI